MTDFSAKIQAFITKVENAVYGGTSDKADGEINTKKEITVFNRMLAEANQKGEISDEEYTNNVFGLEKSAEAISGRRSAPKHAPAGGTGDGEDGGDGNTIVININTNIYIALTVNIDKEFLENLIKQLLEGQNSNFENLINFINEKGENFMALLMAFFEKFDGDQNTDLAALIEKLIAAVNANGEKLNELNGAVNEMLRFQFEALKTLGISLGNIENLLSANNEGQAENNKMLIKIYEAIMKFADDFGNFSAEQKQQINTLIGMIGDNGKNIEAVLAMLAAIKADTSETKDLSKLIVQNGQTIIAKLDDLQEFLGISLEKIDADIKSLLVQLIAQGTDFEKIKELLVAMGQDIKEGNEINQENLEINKLILEAVKDLGTEVIAKFTTLINDINKLQPGEQADYRETLKELLAAVKENTAAVNENTRISVENKQEIIDAVSKLGLDTMAGFQAIIDAVNNGNKAAKALLEKLLEAVRENNAIAKEILDYVKEFGVEAAANLNTIIDLIKNRPASEQADYTAKLDEILAAIRDNTAAVNENTRISEQNKKEIIEAISKLGVDTMGGFQAILDAINNGNADAKALLDKILKAIRENTEAVNNNTEAVNNNTRISDENQKAIMELIEGYRGDFNQMLRVVNNIYDKMGNLENAVGDVNANLGVIVQLMRDYPVYDWDALMNALDNIASLIRDHEVHVEVDCHCTCDGNTNEGIQRNLAKAFGFGLDDDYEDAVQKITADEIRGKQLFDLGGRPVTQPRPNTVYVVEGKKVMFTK